MIKIIKNGNPDCLKKKITIYKHKCEKCGCEFEFDKTDVDTCTFGVRGSESIRCPYCKHYYYYTSLNDDFEHREVEIEGEQR